MPARLDNSAIGEFHATGLGGKVTVGICIVEYGPNRAEAIIGSDEGGFGPLDFHSMVRLVLPTLARLYGITIRSEDIDITAIMKAE